MSAPPLHNEAEVAPRDVYAARLGERNGLVANLERHCRRLSHSRLAIFVALLFLSWFAFGTRVAPLWPAIIALGAFVLLIIVHDRSLRQFSRAQLAAAHYKRGIARIDGNWSGSGSGGSDVRPLDHDYADDLDLFGEGSLFELISTARTPLGERSLASWLANRATTAEIQQRQNAIAELTPRLELREDLASLSNEVVTLLDGESLIAWAEKGSDAASASRLLRSGLGLLALATIVSLILWLRGSPPQPFEVLALFVLGATRALRARGERAADGLDSATRTFSLFSRVLARLEKEKFDDPLLVRLHGELVASTHSASKEIARLRQLTALRDAMRNQFFMPIGALLLWGPQVSLAIETWRATNGPRVEKWLASLGDLEALISLSAFAYEHPEHTFPEIAEAEGGPVFDALGLGHPLIPEDQRIRNDLCLSGSEPVCIVSGSNMSGKSTLLRSVGVGVAMAQAGAPVCARSMRLSPLDIGASLRIVDSLQTGTSHFYAELVRLRRIVDIADRAEQKTDGSSLLFLLDEVLHGTNSHDRRIGADKIVRSLLARGSLGLVTTHDLALAKIADELAPDVRNVHFEDQLVDGQLKFDYALKPGVVERSNALDLMREIGLDV
ncbi:MAG: DNA mismatch repair protein MutS [Myxococcota bacterium]|nr:DNA mismatch repair protein MutS [Myxococcota bacterium]